MSKENTETTFTVADIFWESTLRFCKGNPFEAILIIVRGIEYNKARATGDSDKIAEAYHRLPKDLRELKKNFLNRGKGHW